MIKGSLDNWPTSGWSAPTRLKSVWLTKMTMIDNGFHSILFPYRLPQPQRLMGWSKTCPAAKFEVCQDLSPSPQVMLGSVSRSNEVSVYLGVISCHWKDDIGDQKSDGALQKRWNPESIAAKHPQACPAVCRLSPLGHDRNCSGVTKWWSGFPRVWWINCGQT